MAKQNGFWERTSFRIKPYACSGPKRIVEVSNPSWEDAVAYAEARIFKLII